MKHRFLLVFTLLVPPWLLPVTAVHAQGLSRPNIVLIMTDDQRWDTLRYMPNVQALIARGTSYPNAFVPNALCCPSRASTLTGTYSHVNGVWGNSMPNGGFDAFRDDTTIATALRSTGYETLFVGKYLNGYPGDHFKYVPPGWDEWFSVATGAYYNYFVARNGSRSQFFGDNARDYSGRVLTKRAIAYMHQVEGAPFFMYYAPAAPHGAERG